MEAEWWRWSGGSGVVEMEWWRLPNTKINKYKLSKANALQYSILKIPVSLLLLAPTSQWNDAKDAYIFD